FVVHAARLVLPSFPTRRSSDLGREAFRAQARSHRAAGRGVRPKSGSSNVAESPCPWEKNKKRPGKCRGVRPAGGERKSPPGASPGVADAPVHVCAAEAERREVAVRELSVGR